MISPDEFVQNFAELTDGYTRDQIFNCDEAGLYYKMLQGRTPTTVHDDPIGAKKAKERITINACANTTGKIKLPLLFIGKYNNPRCFRGVNKETLPMIYRHQKNAWVDATIFKDWFQNHFVPMAKEKLIELGVEPKVQLIMDNCSVHPSEEELNTDDGSAKSHFLPPNVTSLIQPMDQGVLECMKRIYRKSLLGGDNMITYLNGLHTWRSLLERHDYT